MAPGRLVITDGRVRVQDGDIDAALDCLLAAAVQGGHRSRTRHLDGRRARRRGELPRAGRNHRVAPLRGVLPPAQRDRVERALLALGPRMPRMEDGVQKQRLVLHQIATLALATGEAPPGARPSPDEPGRFVAAALPALALLADSLWKQDRFFARIQEFARDDRDPILFVSLTANAEPRSKTVCSRASTSPLTA